MKLSSHSRGYRFAPVGRMTGLVHGPTRKSTLRVPGFGLRDVRVAHLVGKPGNRPNRHVPWLAIVALGRPVAPFSISHDPEIVENLGLRATPCTRKCSWLGTSCTRECCMKRILLERTRQDKQ